MRRVALIDGDILVYRTGFAGEQSLVTALVDGRAVVQDAKNKTEAIGKLSEMGIPEEAVTWERTVLLDEPSHVFHSLDQQVRSILRLAGTERHQIFITGSGNFREKIAVTQPYKGNRENLQKPAYYEDIRARLVKRWGAYEVQGAEADDEIAIHLTENKNAISCSIDKDLRQVPGKHLNWLKEPSPVQVSQEDADHWLFCQALAGDPTDNIPGIPKIGTKTASKILQAVSPNTWDALYSAVRQKYVEYLGDEAAGDARFKEMLALVYLLRTRKELELAKQAACQGYPYIPTGTTAQAELPVPTVRKKNRSWRRHAGSQPRNWPRKNGSA